MNLHEYQAKQLLAACGVATPSGVVVKNAADAEHAITTFAATNPGQRLVVKAQIHAGGRGKAGGVKLFERVAEAAAFARSLLGSTLITAQTGPQGKQVNRVWVEAAAPIAAEFYLTLLIDRARCCPAFVASRAGGMDIEQVAATTPEQMLHLPIDPATGFQPFHGRKLAAFLGLSGKTAAALGALAGQIYGAMLRYDASMIECNPLALLENSEWQAVDAKMTLDDNALFRHPELKLLRDLSEEDPNEVEASQFGLNYIQLDGNIGCMVNGAGLAMATMDIIKLKGQSPANFLDVGGGVTESAVEEAFKLLFSNGGLKAILVNIFGGIVRCDIIARGLLNAAAGRTLSVPIVLRLVGTREAEGRALISESGLPVLWANDLDEAANLACAAAR